MHKICTNEVRLHKSESPVDTFAIVLVNEQARPLLEERGNLLVDPRLDCYSEIEVDCMLHAAACCIRRDPLQRPRMAQVGVPCCFWSVLLFEKDMIFFIRSFRCMTFQHLKKVALVGELKTCIASSKFVTPRVYKFFGLLFESSFFFVAGIAHARGGDEF